MITPFFLMALLTAGDGQAIDRSAACQALKAQSQPQVSITIAEYREAAPRAGAGAGRGAGPAPATQGTLPPHCRVVAMLTPSTDSQIEVEIWFPEKWNGKFQMAGNNGWAGNLSYAAMTTAMTEGYATASTDTGHKGGNGIFAIGHPEKLVDFAYRAVHDTAVLSKAMIAEYYAKPAQFSYFNGCSLGGRQALMEAQKYPADFDGIIAGAAANPTAHLHSWDVITSLHAVRNPEAIVPAAKLAIVNKAVIAACDGQDGVADGILGNPRACRFDVATLQCRTGDSESCLTAAQVESVKRAYSPAKNARGQAIYPGKDFGSEPAWTGFLAGRVPGTPLQSFLIAHADANWDPRLFELERDLKLVDEKIGAVVDVNSGDLRAFKARGGKLILYHGWNDVLVSPGNTIEYQASVEKALGGSQDSWLRVFMAPGMDHCTDGVGPSQANWMAALERWREGGSAPARIDAARVANNRIEMSRPLCPYPQVAVYNGSGSTNDAASFSCRVVR